MPEKALTKGLLRSYVTGALSRRQFLERAGIVGLSLPAAIALLSACGGSRPTSSSPSHKLLTLRLTSDIQNLDPAFEPQDPDLQTIFNIYENLVSFKPGTFQLVNTLADKLAVSPDGMKVTFTLKKGVQFHGGYGELTADDVKFSFERIAGLTTPRIDSPYKGLWSTLKGVTVTDTYSGVIELAAPYAPLMTLAIAGNPGHIVSRKAVTERGTDYALHPIGTGPYQFDHWVPSQSITLKKFANYSGNTSAYAAAPIWDSIEFRPIGDDNAADIALESGQLDFGQIQLSSIDRFKANSRFAVDQRTSFGYKFVAMNVQNPKFLDIRVRQAVRTALDVPSMLAAAFNGKWARATAVIPPGMPLGYWNGAPTYKRDVAKAKSLMTAAGVSDLAVTLTYDQTEPGGSTVAQIVQANLKDIGIRVNIVAQEHAVFNTLGAAAQKTRELMYIGFNTQPDPAQSMQWFTCAQINKWNFMGWCNDGFTADASQASVQQDKAKRQALYVEMQKLWDEATNTVWVAWPTLYFASQKTIKPALRPDGRMVAWAFRTA
jgi:peptide/nickel transport system substrate-binding protein